MKIDKQWQTETESHTILASDLTRNSHDAVMSVLDWITFPTKHPDWIGKTEIYYKVMSRRHCTRKRFSIPSLCLFWTVCGMSQWGSHSGDVVVIPYFPVQRGTAEGLTRVWRWSRGKAWTNDASWLVIKLQLFSVITGIYSSTDGFRGNDSGPFIKLIIHGNS